MMIGITRGTTRAHLVRATLEGIVYSTKDFLDIMRKDSGVNTKSIKVDGGARNDFFWMQLHADMLHAEVVRPINPQATSLGAAYMAGLAVGYWKSPEECFAAQKIAIGSSSPRCPPRNEIGCTGSGPGQSNVRWVGFRCTIFK
jgi:glycerol kinase